MSWFHLPSCSEERRAFGKKCLPRRGLAQRDSCRRRRHARALHRRGHVQVPSAGLQ